MTTLNTTLVALTSLAAVAFAAPADAQDRLGTSTSAQVRHGDANGDGRLDMSDVKEMLAILFGGKHPTVSKRDLDFNQDGRFDIADVESAGRAYEELGARPCERCTERVRVGDTNDDGKVDIADLEALARWLTTGQRYGAPKEAADVNGDGRVDIADLSVLAEAFS